MHTIVVTCIILHPPTLLWLQLCALWLVPSLPKFVLSTAEASPLLQKCPTWPCPTILWPIEFKMWHASTCMFSQHSQLCSCCVLIIWGLGSHATNSWWKQSNILWDSPRFQPSQTNWWQLPTSSVPFGTFPGKKNVCPQPFRVSVPVSELPTTPTNQGLREVCRIPAWEKARPGRPQ